MGLLLRVGSGPLICSRGLCSFVTIPLHFGLFYASKLGQQFGKGPVCSNVTVPLSLKL